MTADERRAAIERVIGEWGLRYNVDLPDGDPTFADLINRLSALVEQLVGEEGDARVEAVQALAAAIRARTTAGG